MSSYLDKAPRTEVQARAELGEPISDDELEQLRDDLTHCGETTTGGSFLAVAVRPLIARLDAAEQVRDDHMQQLERLITEKAVEFNENTRLKADVAELSAMVEELLADLECADNTPNARLARALIAKHGGGA